MNSLRILVLISFLTIDAAAQDLYFPPNFSEEWDTVTSDEIDWCADGIEEFETFLAETNTKACIILKDGKIAHESYYDDFDLTKTWYWASAAKSLTAGMIGILQEENTLNISEKTATYLGDGWTNCSSVEENEITLRHQLTMTSGLDYTLDDIYCTEPECLQCLNEPGEEWFYHNAPYTLLADVMESATGENYTSITNSKLTNKIGFIGLWTNVNTGRLFFSTARGMARYGLLMLNNGDWDGEAVISDKDYIQAMITPSQEINKSYGYLWWLNGQESYRLPGTTITFPGSLVPTAPDDLYAAIGKNGQILMVVPSQNLVIVRMGDNPDNSLVPTSYVNDLWNAYEKLSCTVSTNTVNTLEFSVKPKLAFHRINISTAEEIDAIAVFDTKGNKLLSSQSRQINVSDLKRGLYFVQVVKGRKSATQKFFKF